MQRQHGDRRWPASGRQRATHRTSSSFPVLTTFTSYKYRMAGQCPPSLIIDGLRYLIHARLEFALLVTLDHLLYVERLDLGGVARGAEGRVTRLADFFHRLDGGGEEFARIDFLRVVGHGLAHRAGRRHAQGGGDVDLAHAVLDTFDDFFDRHAVGLAHVAAVAVDDLEPFLRHRRRTVHHQMGVGNARVDFLDAADRENVAGGRTAELIRAMAGADGDGERGDLGLLI